MGRFSLYLLSFLGGYLIMGLELMGFRVLAPNFGYSLYVFGSLIGLVLLALSGGYLFGGWLGDRGVTPHRFFAILFGGSLYLLAMRASYPSILAYLAAWGNISGALAATFILFFIPLTLLGAVSPYCTKRMHTALGAPVGMSAGSIYAVGTMGSLAGTFLTAFYTLPEWGSRATFSFLATGMLLFSLVPLIAVRRRYLLGFSGLLLLAAPAVRDSNVLFETDSPYAAIEVVDYGDFLGLRTDRRSGGIHSYRLKDGVKEGDRRFLLYDFFAVGPVLTPVRRALLLGVAGGVIPATHERFGQTFRTDGVELDSRMLEVGRRYFHVSRVRNLTLSIADARAYLNRTDRTYDLIEADLFSGSAEVPFHLVTKEFFALTRARLAREGLFLMNLYDPSRHVIREAVLNTIAAVYPYVYFVDLGTGSHFVLATANDAIAGTLERGPAPVTEDDLARLTRIVLDEKERFLFDSRRLVLTDDRAPIERLSYRAIYRGGE